MTGAPHLLTEDRPDFERLLDKALRGTEYAVGAGRARHLNPEQLRTMALSAMAAISACATGEYERYVRLRTEMRRPTSAGGPGAGPGSGPGGRETMRFANAMGQMTDSSSSAGVAAAAAVLIPVLAGSSAAIFLLVGYLLHMMRPEPSVALPLIRAGWVFALLAVGAIVIAMVLLLMTALKNGATSIRAAANRELAEEVDRAREDWHNALLERGIRPFLDEALEGGNPDGNSTLPASLRDPSVSRTPRLGYSRPAFSSPDEGPSSTESPGYSSPDFTSPDYGGPEHEPD